MILYGDMDISTIHEMPANRIPIKNCVIKSSKRPTAYQFIEKELQHGHQAYVICHLIEESEDSEYENVIRYHEKLCVFFQHKYQHKRHYTRAYEWHYKCIDKCKYNGIVLCIGVSMYACVCKYIDRYQGVKDA